MPRPSWNDMKGSEMKRVTGILCLILLGLMPPRLQAQAQVDRDRSLSGVIAHEVTHLLIRNRFGYLKDLTLPAWKREGYSEYVAGGTLLDYETGMRRWKKNPADDSGYRYFKYYMLVKHLIGVKKLSVEEVFTRAFDVQSLEREVLISGWP